ncbi:uncharacterized protein B0H18DRAFT_1033021 [Fomitopsis serialis]|uniref:uncharacterized protein n=1 Tax=Fomitopsis serialis TaxID=139415 RepID=UPI002007B55B|nr:uncharacterized protein B0H18DRAFT_1033021 [Neoantrodia serialis]KAH9917965.1 hypothetical protein B0H18DRAFT_1033021 [Neoantrodia serialis]
MKLVISNYTGPLFAGLILSHLLYGVTVAQTLFYFCNYQSDTRAVKSWVVAIWLLDTAKIITEAHQLWDYFVTAHGNIFALLPVDPYICVRLKVL